ncbi:hypothetical protein TraAM80_00012 [Trypanosoma rangeli]|uniref:Uncharacterized protein n=1 Tax=Trypanosoma rangeli TaxID=5698 RepID=A0A422P569_TRYRA|nr:uncharacterized protein TraAM80_00012 [Trypanosoma rangeli]RNF12856.1 hypothetical protein TraAM80_00012 [Trypanosoma rangeli]|eukprot:RNF12856.1 hypothetical protein TraAM80_00012 [Trypanosoma rangeli]
MLDEANGVLNAGGSNLSVVLNPKLVTHREEDAGVIVDKPQSASAPFASTPKEVAHRRPKQGARATSNAAVSARGLDRSRSRNASVPPMGRPGLRHANPFAKRYSHVHSVVKDLIEEKISPIDAQYGRPVEKQHLESIAPASTCWSPLIRRSLYSTAHSGSGFVTPRRSSNSSLQKSSLNMSKNSTPFRSSSHTVVRRRTNVAPKASSSRTERSPERVELETPPRRNISEYAYVSKVVDKLHSARVPYNHVPQCAQKIPERLKYRPSPSPPDAPHSPDNAETEQKVSSSRRKNNTPTSLKRSSLRQTPLASDSPRNQTASKGTRDLYCNKHHAMLDGTALSNVAAFSPGRHSVSAEEKKTRYASSGHRLLRAKIKMFETGATEEECEQKPLLGLERLLLFDTEPPCLLK